MAGRMAWVGCLAILGCSGSSGSPPPGSITPTTTGPDQLFVEPPTLELNPDPAAPLIGALRARTLRPATLEVTIEVAGRQLVRTSDAPATEHALTLLGFRADRTHTIWITAVEATARTPWPEPLSLTTAPLPPDFPSLSLVESRPEREPGVDLFHVDAPDPQPEYAIVTDSDGEVVWYYAAGKSVNHVLQLSSGNLMYMPDRYWIEEIDLWGRTVRRFKSQLDPSPAPTDVQVPTLGFHHDVLELPSGNLLALGIELRHAEDYPASERIAGPTEASWVAYDRVVEFQPDGTLVHDLPLADVLDPLRIGHESVQGRWWSSFAGFEVKDWAHSNAIFLVPGTDRLLVSLRNQDAVIQLSYPDGALDWILAPPENWTEAHQPYLLSPVGAQTRQPYHQHAIKWTSDGTLLLFDNGNYQASAYQPPIPGSAVDSRAVELLVDPVAGTFEQVWQWDRLPEPNFSPGLGNVQLLPQTGHVLITYGAVGGDEAYDARVIEVDRGSAEVVFDLAVDQGHGRIYRAVRLPSLYPDGTPIH